MYLKLNLRKNQNTKKKYEEYHGFRKKEDIENLYEEAEIKLI